MELIATYNTGAQVGEIYNVESEVSTLFVLVDEDRFMPISTRSPDHGDVPVPECFSPRQELLDALHKSRKDGASIWFEIDD